MEIWAIVVILILLLAVGGFAGLTFWTEHENSKKQQSNIIYPFTGAVNPKRTGQKVVLTRAPDGKNQIECPVGTHVNIIGAWVEVNDPFGECSTPNSTFRATCGDDADLSSAVNCSDSGQCASGMDCIAEKCVAASCSAASDCGANSCPVNPGTSCNSSQDCGGSPMVCQGGQCLVDPSLGQCMFCKNGRCAQAPTCSNLNNKYQNTTCVATNAKNKCRPRDASAYLADACNGKQSCTVDWDPSSSKYFGPLPCQVGVNDSQYPLLPIIPGWDGGKPFKGDKGDVSANYKQGYYIHGVYTCINSDE